MSDYQSSLPFAESGDIVELSCATRIRARPNELICDFIPGWSYEDKERLYDTINYGTNSSIQGFHKYTFTLKFERIKMD